MMQRRYNTHTIIVAFIGQRILTGGCCIGLGRAVVAAVAGDGEVGVQ